MKKYIIIIALSLCSALSAMENHITTIITPPASGILYNILRDKGLPEKQAITLSQCIGNKKLQECHIYKHIAQTVFSHHVQNKKEGIYKPCIVQINDLMTSIKKASIIHTTNDDPINAMISKL